MKMNFLLTCFNVFYVVGK